MFICRQWTLAANGDYTSEFDRFETEAEAREYGEVFVSLKLHHEISRDYEVYDEGAERS